MLAGGSEGEHECILLLWRSSDRREPADGGLGSKVKASGSFTERVISVSPTSLCIMVPAPINLGNYRSN